MFINSISCNYKEYRLLNGVWKLSDSNIFNADSVFIQNMIDCQSSFEQLGGHMVFYYGRNRRFGYVCNKIVSVSICNSIKKVFNFNYNKAQV